MLDVSSALARMLARVTALDSVEAPLHEALGRRLAEEIVADRDAPPADRSAMDGYAVRAGDGPMAGATLEIVGEVRAGASAEGLVVRPGEAVRIFTGGLVPAGADAVVMIERTVEDPATGRVRIVEPPKPGANIRRRGEEARAGATIVEAGTELRPAEIAALASVGRTRARVVRAARVAVASTGDEVVASETVPAPHQVRDSNARMLLAELASIGAAPRDLGVVRDEAGALDDAVAEGLREDVLLLTGGVSVGAYDLVRPALERAGCEVIFHGVAMRPGKPILVAARGGHVAFGLPGNPLSAYVGFHVFVRPALRKLMGDPRPEAPTVRARLAARLDRKPGRASYALARLDRRASVVAPVPHASSGDVLALVRANAFIVAPADAGPIEAGDEVDVLPWD